MQQKTLLTNALSNDTGQLGEFFACEGFNPAKPYTRSIPAADVDSIQKQHMEMYISCEVHALNGYVSRASCLRQIAFALRVRCRSAESM